MSEKLPEYFYLYLRMDAFGLKKLIAFVAGRLPLTNPKRFNDPFDTKFELKYAKRGHQLSEGELRLADNRFFSQEFIVSAAQEADSASKRAMDWERSQKFRICCFSEHWDSLLMWAHYADSHKGICLQFRYDDKKRPPGCWFERVRYSTHYPKIDESKAIEFEETLLLTKSAEWMYESEWRFISLANESPCDCGFDGLIEPSPFSLENIYFGVNYSVEGPFTELRSGKDVLGAEMVEDVSKALDQSWVAEKPEDATSVLSKAIEKLEILDEDTIAVSKQKRKVLQHILHEFIGNIGSTKCLEKSMDEFQVVVGSPRC
jgi:hypothetical protein